MNPQSSGKQFEVIFHKIALNRGFHPDRIPNGYQPIKGRPIRGFLPGFRVKTPFDFILEHDELGMAFLDLKTVSTKKFQALLISWHQLEILKRYSKWHVAGFLIWYRFYDRVVFIDPHQIGDKKQLEMSDGLDIGDLSNMDLKLLMDYNRSDSKTNYSSQNVTPDRGT